MRSRPVLIAFIFGVLLMLSVPVVADHVQEPTGPIVDVQLVMYRYTAGRASALACTGSEVFPDDNMRIEADLVADGRPSEHWDTRLEVRVPRPGFPNLSPRIDWNSFWKHQNVPPHFNPNRPFEILQTNQYNMRERPGMWEVRVMVTGTESGIVLSDTCKFLVP